MIQRIQTVYLLLATILTGLLLKLNLADIFASDQLYTFTSGGIFKEGERIFNGLPLQIFIIIIIATHLVAVFNFRNRIRQIRILVFTEILLLGLVGLILYFAYGSFKDMSVAFKIPVAFPLVAIILDFFAIRAIGSDEALIRSIDRIRSKKK